MFVYNLQNKSLYIKRVFSAYAYIKQKDIKHTLYIEICNQ